MLNHTDQWLYDFYFIEHFPLKNMVQTWHYKWVPHLFSAFIRYLTYSSYYLFVSSHHAEATKKIADRRRTFTNSTGWPLLKSKAMDGVEPTRCSSKRHGSRFCCRVPLCTVIMNVSLSRQRLLTALKVEKNWASAIWEKMASMERRAWRRCSQGHNAC